MKLPAVVRNNRVSVALLAAAVVTVIFAGGLLRIRRRMQGRDLPAVPR